MPLHECLIYLTVNSAAQLSSFECLFFKLLDSLNFLWNHWLNSSIWNCSFLPHCLWVAIGFLLICSDFMLWQQKLTLACVPTSSLAWCEGSSVFLLLSRLSSTIFHCTQFVHATYDISVLFQMSCHWSGNRCLTLQFNGMILVHSCFFFSADWVVMLINVELVS